MKSLKAQENFKVSRLFYSIWRVIAEQIESPAYQQTYFFWDTLASSIAVNPTIASLKHEKINVTLNGKSEGQTNVDHHGFVVEMAIDPNPKKLHELILKLFKN